MMHGENCMLHCTGEVTAGLQLLGNCKLFTTELKE